jgi:hypothetical protein
MVTDMIEWRRIRFFILSQEVEEHLSMFLRKEEDFSIMFGVLSRREG